MDDEHERLRPLADHEWAYRRPPVLMPLPAADACPLTGQRLVIWAEPGLWRYDVRAASEPHRYEGRWCVGILDEADYYRRQRQPELSASIVPTPYPLDWLWVERPVDAAEIGPTEPDQSEVQESMGFARHLVDAVSAPPVHWLRSALSAPAVNPGSRAVLMTETGPEWDLRVCGAPRLAEFPQTLDLSGGPEQLDDVPIGPKVPLCWEDQWYRWSQDGVPPNATECWLVPVWLE